MAYQNTANLYQSNLEIIAPVLLLGFISSFVMAAYYRSNADQSDFISSNKEYVKISIFLVTYVLLVVYTKPSDSSHFWVLPALLLLWELKDFLGGLNEARKIIISLGQKVDVIFDILNNIDREDFENDEIKTMNQGPLDEKENISEDQSKAVQIQEAKRLLEEVQKYSKGEK